MSRNSFINRAQCWTTCKEHGNHSIQWSFQVSSCSISIHIPTCIHMSYSPVNFDIDNKKSTRNVGHFWRGSNHWFSFVKTYWRVGTSNYDICESEYAIKSHQSPFNPVQIPLINTTSDNIPLITTKSHQIHCNPQLPIPGPWPSVTSFEALWEKTKADMLTKGATEEARPCYLTFLSRS